ncbi:hypothetical protein J6590_092348, partial [Homalodisca vitripennis]
MKIATRGILFVSELWHRIDRRWFSRRHGLHLWLLGKQILAGRTVGGKSGGSWSF